MSCIFCKIMKGEIPSKRAYEDDQVVAFHDLNPQAPTHILVIPREHVASVDDVRPEHAGLGTALLLAAQKVAKTAGADEGYRLVINTGPDAGQTVFHIHVHVLAGRRFSWPPG